MKKCPSCLHENADDMNFCLNCGKPLGESRPPGWLGNDDPTTAFGETPTTVRKRSFETQTLPRDFSFTSQPRGSNKLLVVLGGVAALIILLFAAAAAIIGYKY